MKCKIDHHTTVISHAQKSILSALLIAGIAHVDLAQAAAVNTGDKLTIDSATFDGNSLVNGGSYFMMDINGSGTFTQDERFGMQQGTLLAMARRRRT